MHYRAEVDGLRAVAVLAVLLFHAGALIPGGFVGVDVFFVISGYVITRSLAAELDSGDFSLLGFYERRIRRIAPALIVVILVTALASAFVLLPIDLKAMGKSAVAAALMVSNMLFWEQSGYFDAAAQTKPLLHTWSLGIEEQFYLVFPLLLAALWRKAKSSLVPVLGALFLASLALAVWRVGKDPGDAFYLAPYRFWELLLGALIALRPIRRLEGSGFAFLGLGMIAASFALFSEATKFPGASALLPTFGAALVINGARESMAAARLLGARPLVFVGKLSYSLYLVHWPLIVLVEYRQDARLDLFQAVIVIVVSFALAWLSWRYVEEPFRRRGQGAIRPRVIFGGAGVATALACSAGAAFALSGGLPQRLPKDVREIYAAIPQQWEQEPACFIDTRGKSGPSVEDIRAGRLCSLGLSPEGRRPDFLVWGDSHAAAMAPAIFKAGDQANARGVFVGAGSCPPLTRFKTLTARAATNRRCRAVNDATFELLQRERIPLVFLVARWARAATGVAYGDEGMFFDPGQIQPPLPGEDVKFAAALEDTMGRLEGMGIQVVVVLDVPEAGYAVPYSMAKARMAGRDVDLSTPLHVVAGRDERSDAIIREAAARTGADVIEPDTFFCNDKVCEVARNGVPLYRDSDHITRATALALAPMFEGVMKRQMAAQGAAEPGGSK